MAKGTTRAKKPEKQKAKTKSNGNGMHKPKPTAEQLGEQDLQRLFFQHKRKLKPLLLAEATAKAAVTKAYEIAKKEGITKKELQLAIAMETDEGEEKIGAEVARTLRVARWMGIKLGTQLEMFGKDDPAEKDFEDGRRAALDDQPRKPPNHLSNAAQERWMSGHAAGTKQMNESREEGFKPLGDVARGIVPGASAVDSIAAH